jgi:uncharacterized cupin superfamily protein
MTTNERVIRFEPNGPSGLKPMTLDPNDFHTMPEEQTLNVYFEDAELGMSAGVWTTTPMQESFDPYPGDEFIFVVDGHFDMMDTVDGSGSNVRCSKGQSIIFRNGVPVSWKQHDTLKKFYITYMDPRAETPQGLNAAGGIQALDPDMVLSDEDLLPDTSTPQREMVFFKNEDGNFKVGLWDTQTLNTDMEPFPWHKFAQVLEGEVTITNADGSSETFVAGDVFFVPAGTRCTWHVPNYLRKYYAALDPNIRPGG